MTNQVTPKNIHQKIGYILILFQQMEQQLKRILDWGFFLVTVSADNPYEIKREKESSMNFTLGQIVNDYLENTSPGKEFLHSNNDATFLFRISAFIEIGWDDETFQRFKKNIKDLVKERNEFVHKLILNEDYLSQDRHDILLEKLTALEKKIINYIKIFGSLVKLIEKQKKYLESEECQNKICLDNFLSNPLTNLLINISQNNYEKFDGWVPLCIAGNLVHEHCKESFEKTKKSIDCQNLKQFLEKIDIFDLHFRAKNELLYRLKPEYLRLLEIKNNLN